MAFSDPSHDIDQLIAGAMGSAVEGASKALAEEIRRRSDTDRRDARTDAFRLLREACARLDATHTQVETLTALIEEAARFASRTALLLTFTDGARGWAAHGFDGAGIEDLALGYDTPGLSTLAAGRGMVTLGSEASRALAQRFGAGAPVEAILVPLVLRDRSAAALYADRLRAEDDFAPAALQLLVFTAAQVLELQGMRQRAATPTLHGADREPPVASLPLWDAAEAAAAVAVAPTASAEPPSAPVAPPPPPPAWHEPAAVAEPLAAAPAWEEPAAPPWAEAEPEPDTAQWHTAEEATEPAAASEPELEPFAVEPVALEEPAWQIEEAAADVVEAAPEMAAEPAAEAGWSYEPASLEEAPTEPEVAAEPVLETPVLETYAEDLDETGATAVEELPVEPVVEAEPAWRSPDAEPTPWYRPAAAAPAQTSPWQVQPSAPLTPPESTTTPLYPEAAPAYPSEATVRISRDLLPSGPAAALPLAAPAAADPAEDPTVLLRRNSMSEQPTPEVERTRPTPTVPEPAPRPSPLAGLGGGGSTEVQAPPDLEGPGWAFRAEALQSPAAYQPQNEESSALHDEARRLARLLVSEIKLYNEEQVEEGRRNRDIYPRLQDDIDRSRQMYEDRVDPRVRDEIDYFQQEMVNILAAGDADALGM